MTLALRYAQAAFFRARRSGLITPHQDLATAAAHLLGAQAQVEASARWALALRTAGHPDSAAVQRALIDQRSIVRAWGQRDTVHIYAPADWVLIATAQALWPRSARTGAMPSDDELADFIAAIDKLGRTFTRSDVVGLVPGRLVDAFAKAPVNDDPPERMAATRLIWKAGTVGALCASEMSGREQAYAARTWWLPELAWPAMTAEAAAVALTRRYLATWGPATVHDLAHFFGANVSTARTWVAALGDAVADVTVAEPRVPAVAALALTADLDALALAPPSDDAAWPTRLLPGYDTYMMTHANKDFVVPDPDARPRIWAKAARVHPTVVQRGCFVGTWTHKARARSVEITVEALPGHRLPLASTLVDRDRFEQHLLARSTP